MLGDDRNGNDHVSFRSNGMVDEDRLRSHSPIMETAQRLIRTWIATPRDEDINATASGMRSGQRRSLQPDETQAFPRERSS
jgi:hypothetical protein